MTIPPSIAVMTAFASAVSTAKRQGVPHVITELDFPDYKGDWSSYRPTMRFSVTEDLSRQELGEMMLMARYLIDIANSSPQMAWWAITHELAIEAERLGYAANPPQDGAARFPATHQFLEQVHRQKIFARQLEMMNEPDEGGLSLEEGEAQLTEYADACDRFNFPRFGDPLPL